MMANVYIDRIQSEAHLRNAFEYIYDKDKTDWHRLTDSYKCVFSSAEIDFGFIRDREVIEKGKNLAWHITQSFSPEDNVSPEQALEIGKELMRRMYPNYQYVIATHIDKRHIHNHIILNSVNFVDYHKLHSNYKTLKELRGISDEICRENGLSVIQPDSKNNKLRLADNIDKAIEESPDYKSFLKYMKELGYEVKSDKSGLKFKDSQMERFIAAKSISQSYSEDIIKYRIANKDKNIKVTRNRTKWDDKHKTKNKTQNLKADMDIVLKKAESFDDFINKMKELGYEVKQGEHLAFRKIEGDGTDEKSRFRRSEKLGLYYTEEVLRWRLKHREEYEKMAQKRIERCIVKTDEIESSRALREWAAGENTQRALAAFNFIRDNLVDEWLRKNNYVPEAYNKNNPALNFAVFLEYYDKKKEALDSLETEAATLQKEMADIHKMVKSLERYFILKPVVDKYKSMDYNQMSDEEKLIYRNIMLQRNHYAKIISDGHEVYGTYKIKELWQIYNSLRNKREEVMDNLTREKIDFEVYETVKYNMESKDGVIHTTREEAKEHLQFFLVREKVMKEKVQRKENRKRAIKGFFGLG